MVQSLRRCQLPYEIFEKKAIRVGSPAVTFSSKDRMAMNTFAAKIFHKSAVEYVLLLWDREHRKVAIKPLSKKDPRAYRLTYGLKANGASFSARSFMNHIGWDSKEKFTAPAVWNEDQSILEFELPAEKLRDERQQKLAMVEADTRKRMRVS
jgi:hypothetical protein